jgi:zinc transport system ATP-binding protein
VNAVVLRDLWAGYEGRSALEGINLELPEGTMMAVVGPNGGGKTTLLKVLLGLIPPARGSAEVLGGSPARARRDIGYLPQAKTQHRAFPVTALDVVLMGLYPKMGLLRWPGRADRENARRLLQDLELGELADRPFAQLSGGQQQRVGIARALAAEPRLLLLDEPSTGLDLVGQESFYRFLGGLRDRHGISVIMVSHDVGGVTAAVDRVALLNRRLHYYGPPAGAFTPETIEQTFGRHMRFLLHEESCPGCEEPRDA